MRGVVAVVEEREEEGKKSRAMFVHVEVGMFKTPPCVSAKHTCMSNTRVSCRHTRRRFARTHGDVSNLNMHTTHQTPACTTHNNTHPEHTPARTSTHTAKNTHKLSRHARS